MYTYIYICKLIIPLMSSFLKKTIIFGLIVLGLYSFIYAIGINSKYEPNDYIDAIIDKHKRVKSIKGKQLLLIAGSNIAFGIDSKIISDSIHLPVTNMGLAAGLGVDFILNEAKDLLKPNDIAVLSIECLGSLEGDYLSKYKAKKALSYTGNYFKADYNAELIIDNYLIRNRLIHLKDAGTSNKNTVYGRKYFNEYGDLTSHKSKPHSSNLMLPPAQNTDKLEIIAAINEFTQYCKAHNISVFYTYPSIAKSAYTKYAKLIDNFSAHLNKIENLEILDTLAESVKPDSLFFDSIFHLMYGERDERSKLIGHHLKNTLKSR